MVSATSDEPSVESKRAELGQILACFGWFGTACVQALHTPWPMMRWQIESLIPVQALNLTVAVLYRSQPVACVRTRVCLWARSRRVKRDRGLIVGLEMEGNNQIYITVATRGYPIRFKAGDPRKDR